MSRFHWSNPAYYDFTPKSNKDSIMIHSSKTWQTYELADPIWESTKSTKTIEFESDPNPRKTGLLLVGLCGNNASTLIASIYSNKHDISWKTRNGVQRPNYYGSVFLSSTTPIPTASGHSHVGLNKLIPMVHPNDLAIHGWDVINKDLYTAIQDNHVMEPDLIMQLEELKELKPMPSVFYPDFYALNQQERVNNVLQSSSKQAHLQQIRKDIKDFKAKNKLDTVVVLWTASTERFSEIIKGVNDTSHNLLVAIEENHPEIAPSTIFAVASILEGAIFINGSPQNTLTDAVLELSKLHQTPVAGSDFKSGQTKMKSVLTEFLINAGIKPLAITSYNHLGNNDGYNLSQYEQFKSKEISKSNVVDDMISSNPLLYKDNEHIDHAIVIKYVPAVGDVKRAMDEYYSDIFMGGKSIITINNICEDSLLAAPLIIDLTIYAELLGRIKYKDEDGKYTPITSCFGGLLSYMLKAPTVSKGGVINSLNKQRRGIENFIRSLVNINAVEDVPIEWILQ
eukprot:NODE_34_length_31639_cov_0.254375.p3 type:complete len:510 gc:universal NODE_34_length_31639_cov_0.254375:4465-5994(+)